MSLFLGGLVIGSVFGTFVGVVAMCAVTLNRMPPIKEDIISRIYETPKRRAS